MTCRSSATSPRTRTGCTPLASTVTAPTARSRDASASSRSSRSTSVDGEGESALIGPGQHQHPLHEPLQACALVEHGVAQFGGADAIGMRLRDLGILSHRRQRRLELVRGVGDEPSLSRLRVLEPREHSVHRVGEATDLISRLGFVDAQREIRGRQLLDLPPHPLDRSERTPDGEPRRERDDSDDEGHRHRQERADRGEGLVDVFGAAAHHDDAVASLALDGRHERRVLGVEQHERRCVALAIGERAEALRGVARGDHSAAVAIDHLPEAVVLDVGKRLGAARVDLVGERRGVLHGGGFELPVQRGAQREPETDGPQQQRERDDGCRHRRDPHADADAAPWGLTGGLQSPSVPIRYPAPRIVRMLSRPNGRSIFDRRWPM